MTSKVRALITGALILCATLAWIIARHQQQDAGHDTNEIVVSDATLNAAISGCGLCQQTGLCDHAFKGTPGHFCITLVSGLPCCCPAGAQCAANAFNCRCRTVAAVKVHSPASDAKWSSLLTLFIMLCCVGCCCACALSQSKRRERHEYLESPVVVNTQYGATADNQFVTYPSAYPSAPAYNESPGNHRHSPHHRSGDGFLAGAVGVVGGLATGMLVSSIFSNRGPETNTSSYFQGDSGYNATSSFDFAGDTGDNQGDFGGDS